MLVVVRGTSLFLTPRPQPLVMELVILDLSDNGKPYLIVGPTLIISMVIER